MNEELQNALVGLISKATSGAELAGEFLVEQVPDVLQQLLMWYGVKEFIYFALSVLIVVATPVCLYFANKSYKDKVDAEDRIPMTLIVMFLTYCCAFLLTNLTWLQIWIAPKVWLLEYAAQMAK